MSNDKSVAVSPATMTAVRKRPCIDVLGRSSAVFSMTLMACLLALVWILKLWRANLHVPFSYTSDSLCAATWIKGIIENGWYFHNEMVGAPSGLNMLDYPVADNLHFFIIKGMTLFSGDYALVLNLFYILTFPLTAMTALFVFRRLNISSPVAVVGSLLFTLLPYHFLRGQVHPFLAAIYVIPLTSMAIIRLMSDLPPFIKKTDTNKEVLDLKSLRSAGYLLIVLLTGSAGTYYAYFACFFFLVAGAYAAIRHNSLKRLAAAGIFIFLIAATLFVNMMPSVVHEISAGRNEEAANRNPVEAEVYGGTITQMVLPVASHRIEAMRALTDEFTQSSKQLGSTIIVNENQWSPLGLIAACGLFILIGWLLLVKGRFTDTDNPFYQSLDSLSVLSASGILFGTIGGFGLLIALLISPQIRAYNRISIYLGFFAILCVMTMLELLKRKYVNSSVRRSIFLGALSLLLIAGILDQTSEGMVPAYTEINNVYARDEAFFQGIERGLPPDSQIFQLPYVRFPESSPVNSITGYDHFRAYLHTKTLRWSFGAMMGRDGDRWQRDISGEPVAQMVEDLVNAGFVGIYINRDGYADQANEIERQLEGELRTKPMTSTDNKLLYFDMSARQAQIREPGI